MVILFYLKCKEFGSAFDSVCIIIGVLSLLNTCAFKDAFWTLAAICQFYVSGYYSMGLVS